MQMSNPLIVDRHGPAMVVRFNRPEIRNPLSIDVLDDLLEIVAELGESRDISALIFTGQENVFASGADLREIAKLNSETAIQFARRGQILMNRLAMVRQTTAAAVNGYCFGGALDLALACDTRIASPNAIFSHPGVDLGIITGWGGTQRLPRLVGQTRALEMFFEAKRVGAQEALDWGLVDVIAENPLDEALRRSLGPR